MGSPVKVYAVVQNGEIKIEIPVFDVEGRCFSAVMIPIARGDTRLMSHFGQHKMGHEVGKTIELAVAACERWVKTNLGQDAAIREKQDT